MSPAPEYLADQNRGPPLLAYFIAILCVTVLAIAVRFYSRLLNGRLKASGSGLWWDDWAALAAVPFILGTLVCGISMIHFGLGHHIWSVPSLDRIPLLKAFFVAQIIYPTAIGLCRASALLFCSRLFRTRLSPNWFRIGIYTAQGLNVAWIIAVTIDKFFICRPFAKSWDSKIPGQCGAVSPYWLGSAISSVVIDLIVLILPLPVIWTLNLSKGRKTALSVVFICGYCVVIISVGRVVAIMRQQSAMATDLTYAAPPVMYWLFGESPMALLSICLPAMSSLGTRCATRLAPLTSMIGSLLSSRHGSQSSPSSQSDTEIPDGSVGGEKLDAKQFLVTVTEPKHPASGYRANASHSSRPDLDNDNEASWRRSTHRVDSDDRSALQVGERSIHVETTFSVVRQPRV